MHPTACLIRAPSRKSLILDSHELAQPELRKTVRSINAEEGITPSGDYQPLHFPRYRKDKE